MQLALVAFSAYFTLLALKISLGLLEMLLFVVIEDLIVNGLGTATLAMIINGRFGLDLP